MPDSIQPNLLILDEVDSTNTYAREHFDDLPDGTLVVARRQTAGRGRRGRSWLSRPESISPAAFSSNALRTDSMRGACSGWPRCRSCGNWRRSFPPT